MALRQQVVGKGLLAIWFLKAVESSLSIIRTRPRCGCFLAARRLLDQVGERRKKKTPDEPDATIMPPEDSFRMRPFL